MHSPMRGPKRRTEEAGVFVYVCMWIVSCVCVCFSFSLSGSSSGSQHSRVVAHRVGDLTGMRHACLCVHCQASYCICSIMRLYTRTHQRESYERLLVTLHSFSFSLSRSCRRISTSHGAEACKICTYGGTL